MEFTMKKEENGTVNSLDFKSIKWRTTGIWNFEGGNIH